MKEFTGIRVNNLGFFPHAKKKFMVKDPPAQEFQVQTIGTDVRWKTVLRGTLETDENGLATGNFSSLMEPADYRILIGDPETEQHLYSEPFLIKNDPLDPVMRMILTGVRWQRCGSAEGWAGCCHQDKVPLKHGLKDTGVRLDVRGGYHQSGDLRCWADGISGAFLCFLRAFNTLNRPWADKNELDGELEWAAGYFLKIVREDGMVYDCQFVPIGWGPRDYYDTPCQLTSHCNIGRLLAGISLRFREFKPEFAAKCLGTAERIAKFVEDPKHFKTAYVPPVPELPPGTQGANFYRQDYRTSARGLAARCALALDLYLATQKKHYRGLAEKLSLEVAALQVTEGPSAGLFRNEPESDEQGFRSCGYGLMLSGPQIFPDLLKALPDSVHVPVWKRVVRCHAQHLFKLFREAKNSCIPYADPEVPLSKAPVLVRGNAVQTGCKAAIFLMDSGLNPAETMSDAQAVVDYILGQNEYGLSYVNGIGWRHQAANIWGQFFPSTPPIPGAVCHLLAGEYDMPAAAMLFLLMEKLRLRWS